jgi:peptide deformylase
MMNLIMAPDPMLEKGVDKFEASYFGHPAPTALDMIDVMNKYGGVGLSANQVGFPAQIFVMKTYLNKKYGSPLVVMNPIIKGLSKEIEQGPEGCLSHPGLIIKVRRPISCIVEFDTLTNDYKDVINVEMKLDDIDARIFLHEYDHLHGIQFIDRVSKFKVKRAEEKRLKDIKKAIRNGRT